ncbi:MAG: hypothetical protein AAGF46_03365 [Pseudomonadota bacterium]
MGVKHWIFQRICNALIIAFGLWLLFTLITNGGMPEETLKQLMASTGFRIFALVTLLFAGLNSLLAGWQIAGDYAEKFGFPQPLMTWGGGVISAAYVVVGCMLLI